MFMSLKLYFINAVKNKKKMIFKYHLYCGYYVLFFGWLRCLNSCLVSLAQAVGFLIDYLSRVAEVKDTIHKQTLLFHVANIVLDQFEDATDLYSDIGSVTRCAKASATEKNLSILVFYKLHVCLHCKM